MKIKTFIWTAALSAAFIACSKSEDGGELSEFSIRFQPDIYETAFYASGETQPLIITSATGQADMVYLSPSTHSSISYSNSTGKVRWTKMLPLGQTTVTVVAALDNRETITTFKVNNNFQGGFTGGYNYDASTETLTHVNFVAQFNSNGTVAINDDGDLGTGTWQRMQDNTIRFIFSYNSSPAQNYTYQGPLFYNNNVSYIEGYFYRGSGVVLGQEKGYFRINLH